MKMISKEMYIKLYCDDAIYKATGVIALNADKVGNRLAIDPLKTIQDLDDYGFSEAMDANHIDEVNVLNTKSGRIGKLPVHGKFSSDKDPFKDEFDSVRKSLDVLNDFTDMMTPATFDWGSEDSIK